MVKIKDWESERERERERGRKSQTVWEWLKEVVKNDHATFKQNKNKSILFISSAADTIII